MGDTILFRRGTAANLPDLQEGEPGFATDNEGFYIGDDTGTAESAAYIGGGVYVDALQYEPNTYTQATIEAALTAIGTVNKVTLLLRPGNWVILNALAFPANVTIKMPFGAYFSGAGMALITLGGNSDVNPQWWGAKGDGIADDTLPFQAAAATGLDIRVPIGTYLTNFTANGQSVYGSGNDRTTLKSYTASGYPLTLKYTTINPALASPGAFREVKDIKFLGDATKGGITFHDQYSSGWVIDRNYFLSCSKGIFKAFGNTRNRIINNYFSAGEFGFYAVTPATMHVGGDLIEGNEFNGQALAGIYLNDTSSVSGSGETLINMNVFEGQLGFSIFVFKYGLSYAPLKISMNWFENNNVGNVTINAVSYTVRDIYFEDTAFAILEANSPYSMQLVNSIIHESGNRYNSLSTVAKDSSSVLTASKIYTTSASTLAGTGRLVDSYGGGGGSGASNSDILLISPRKKMVRGYTSIGGTSFANADTYAFTGTGAITAISVADGILFDSCAEIIIPATAVALPSLGGLSFTSGKFHVWSVDIKLMTTSAPSDIGIVGAGTFVGSIQTALVKDKWVTVGGINTATETSTADLVTTGHATDPITIRFSAFQAVQFDTLQDAIEYFNNGLFFSNVGIGRLIYSTVAPTAGTWAVGDRVINKTPVVGQPLGWRCTVAGTPGTWVAEANL